MIEHFREQIEGNKVVTEESLEQFKLQTYHSGRTIKEGDTLLFAFLVTDDQNHQMIKICSDDFDLYEIHPQNVEKAFVPKIKLR